MENTYQIKKYSTDKIVLLGLFVFALLIARFITASRSSIMLTEPIELNYTGLSVSMPIGNGWQSKKQWKYQQNSFTLTSDFVPASGSVKGQANCRYLLAAGQTSPEIRFDEKASLVEGVIAKTGQIQTDPLIIHWAHITKPETLYSLFFGTARLPDDRRLDIEVLQATGDIDLAERAFEAVAQSLKFQDNQLLKAGSEIVAEIKNIGLDRFLEPHLEKTSQNIFAFFLIKNPAKQTIGFTMDVFNNADSHLQLNIEAASFSYLRRRYAHEQRTFFQSNNAFDEFIWKTQTASPAARSAARIVLDQAGIMTVGKLTRSSGEKNYRLNPATIPRILLELLFNQMLGSYYERIIVDVVEADGTITPAIVSKITTEEKDRYILTLQLLNGSSFYERTSMENILKIFPERADYILQKNRLLEQSRLE